MLVSTPGPALVATLAKRHEASEDDCSKQLSLDAPQLSRSLVQAISHPPYADAARKDLSVLAIKSSLYLSWSAQIQIDHGLRHLLPQ